MDSEYRQRVETTLLLMHRWGYAPTLAALGDELLGGRVRAESLVETIRGSNSIRYIDGFVCLHGWERLIGPSRQRVTANSRAGEDARRIARDFARDLTRFCPFVDVVSLSGSVASGGFEPGDDIDFDLVVQAGTKYISYLAATLVGLKYAWRYRHLELNPLHRTPLLPKITCINVVWPEDQTRPFVRKDAGLAFELLHCQPMLGSERFQRVLAENPWLREFFPQVYDRVWIDALDRDVSPAGRFLSAIAKRPRLLRAFEATSRRIAWILYQLVQTRRARNPAARERMAFLRRVKYPYEVFQD